MAMKDSELTRDIGVEAGGLGALSKMCALMRSTMLSAAETTELAAGFEAITALSEQKRQTCSDRCFFTFLSPFFVSFALL